MLRVKWKQQNGSYHLKLFSLPHNTKQLHPCPTSKANCMVIYSRLATCPVEMEPFKDDSFKEDTSLI